MAAPVLFKKPFDKAFQQGFQQGLLQGQLILRFGFYFGFLLGFQQGKARIAWQMYNRRGMSIQDIHETLEMPETEIEELISYWQDHLDSQEKNKNRFTRIKQKNLYGGKDGSKKNTRL